MTNPCTSLLTAEELLRRASDMVPRLKERAAHTEHLRRLPDETVQDILSSGLHRIAVPKRYGGLDVGYPVMLEVGAALARGCAATAWCYSLWSAHREGLIMDLAGQQYGRVALGLDPTASRGL